MKIISFTVYELLNGTHISYYLALLKKAKECEAVVANARRELEALEAAFQVEDDIMLRARKNPFTEQITEQDSLRDRLWALIWYVVKTSRELPGEGVTKAAKDVYEIMKAYGNLPTMQYDRETGMMYNLCQDLQSKLAAQVETLKLTEAVENMRAANEAFATLLSDRTESTAGFMKNELAAARKDTDAAYYQFVEVVNALSIIDERQVGAQANAYRTFIEWTNAEIDRLKRQALKQRVRTESAEPTAPSEPGWENPGDGTDPDEPESPTPGIPEEGTTPPKFTIDFVHDGQTVASYELEAGAAVTAPAAPSGFHWVNVPSVMPAENVTIHTEADEEEPPILS